MSTVVVGLGNPVLTDDGVGIHVARAVREALPVGCDVAVCEAYAGGLRLLDAMVGYDRAVVVDALWTGDHVPGTVVRMSTDELGMSRNTLSVHDLDLVTALALAKATDLKVPSEIRVLGIEVEDARTFGEVLTSSVRAAVPAVVADILDQLGCEQRVTVHEEEL